MEFPFHSDGAQLRIGSPCRARIRKREGNGANLRKTLEGSTVEVELKEIPLEHGKWTTPISDSSASWADGDHRGRV